MIQKKSSLLKKLLQIWLLCLLTAFSGLLSAQTDSLNNLTTLAEKIYLQLDSKVYTNDQTIWFKGIVANATLHIPSAISRVLYVELIDPNGALAEKKMVKVENGFSEGFFQLNNKYLAGIYLVRAYTEWSRNFDQDFFFQEYVQIYAATKNAANTNPISEVTLRKENNNSQKLTAILQPNLIDSFHKKELPLFITIDGRKDSVSISETDDNKYLLDYKIPDSCQFITLQLLTKNNKRFTKTILVEKDYLDLQFFPESGDMVHGLPAIIGFKALDSSNRGKQVEGQIINSKGEVVAEFKSNVLGMGKLLLANVDSTEKYKARVVGKQQEVAQKVFDLPVIASKGNTLSVNRLNDKITVKIRSNYLVNDSVQVRITCRGLLHFVVKGVVRNGSLEFSLYFNTLPEGIIAFSLLQDNPTPLAERLYFNHRPETRMGISIAASKDSFTQREQTQLNIETKEADGQPMPTNLSLLVLNKNQLGTVQDMRQNILSYFLVSSDLKGEIENPGYYFEIQNDRWQDLDALLLTQGWRKYNYTHENMTTNYKPETALEISGSVSGLLMQKKQKQGVGVTMMTFGQSKSIFTQTTDSIGRFSFNADNEFGDKLNVLIQTTNKAGEKKDYSLQLDKKQPPPIFFNYLKAAEKADSTVQAYVAKSLERKKLEDEYRIQTEGATLADVVVTGYQLTSERKIVAEKYGKPKLVIDGKDIQEKEEKWSYGLYSVMMFKFPDKLRIEQIDGELRARLFNSEPTLVVIDGIPVREVDYPLIPFIPVSEVTSFELIEFASNFMTLYCEVYPFNCVQPPTIGNVIAIYTHGKKGLFGANSPAGIIKAAVPVFTSPRVFYAPKYPQLTPELLQKPDLRTTVFWQPNFYTDSTGKALVSFYNADHIGPMQVVVEAISSKGEIGYHDLIYQVKKRE